MPPEWMSSLSPTKSAAMTEHSMCQPGRPGPHGDGQDGSPALDAFHNAKSDAFSLPCAADSDPSPSSSSSRLPFDHGCSLAYSCAGSLSNLATLKYTDPSLVAAAMSSSYLCSQNDEHALKISGSVTVCPSSLSSSGTITSLVCSKNRVRSVSPAIASLAATHAFTCIGSLGFCRPSAARSSERAHSSKGTVPSYSGKFFARYAASARCAVSRNWESTALCLRANSPNRCSCLALMMILSSMSVTFCTNLTLYPK
ncbi:hypothetical protein OGATHE_004988 [Ogataea polymorpha]|uniref:Uncharacterized protein n=1 Tax=Ogataea polymorpha TaxID=460523 RepID=A0A9P8NWS4_9ASCO|nr:hypothetical protein OGATHE_004988 [Ogataea polymorpha]